MTRAKTWMSRAAVAFGLLSLLALLYVLSVGPAVLFLSGRPWAEPLLDIYVPLEWAYEHTPLREPLGAYVDLWH